MNNVVIVCESSGAVRDAFRARGHNAWSCDLLPADPTPDGVGERYHLRGDCRRILNGDIPRDMLSDRLSIADRPPARIRWDLMIAHPDCTYLTNAAAWAFGPGPYHQKVKPGTLVGEARKLARVEAFDFFMLLANAPIDRIAMENPVGAVSALWRKPDQIIQPWQFGDDASKATCLWLKNLPLLIPMNELPGGRLARRANQTASGQNRLSPGPDRWKERARTYPGIAAAFAIQWGALGQLVARTMPIQSDLFDAGAV